MDIVTAMNVLLILMGVHYLLDFPLQGDFLARAKDHSNPIPGIDWRIPMTAHCYIQAMGVGLVTGSLLYFVLEYIAHWLIDVIKCHKRISFGTDQTLHIMCKVVWVVLFYLFGPVLHFPSITNLG